MGYCRNELDKYWTDVKNILQNVNTKQCLIWATDNNGQIAAEQNRMEKTTEIGSWAMAQKPEKGNGENSQNTATNMDLVLRTRTSSPIRTRRKTYIHGAIPHKEPTNN